MIKINLESHTPAYQQVRDEVVRLIGERKLKPGDNLPSVRSLARDLDLNPMTVQKSYRLLKKQGFIETHRRLKAQVSKLEDLKDRDFEDRLKKLLFEGRARGYSLEELIHEVKTTINLEII